MGFKSAFKGLINICPATFRPDCRSWLPFTGLCNPTHWIHHTR